MAFIHDKHGKSLRIRTGCRGFQDARRQTASRKSGIYFGYNKYATFRLSGIPSHAEDVTPHLSIPKNQTNLLNRPAVFPEYRTPLHSLLKFRPPLPKTAAAKTGFIRLTYCLNRQTTSLKQVAHFLKKSIQTVLCRLLKACIFLKKVLRQPQRICLTRPAASLLSMRKFQRPAVFKQRCFQAVRHNKKSL